MIYHSPYDTSALRGFINEDKVTHAIKTLLAKGLMDSFPPETSIYSDSDSEHRSVLYLMDSALTDVPALKHPFVLDNKTTKDVVEDIRPFLTYDNENEHYRVKTSSAIDYKIMDLRGRLTKAWVTGNPIELKMTSPVPAIVYPRWIASSLTSRMGLEPQEQYMVEIILAYFYQCLFVNGAAPEIEDVAGYMNRHMGYDAGKVVETLQMMALKTSGKKDQLPTVNSVDEVCKLITETTESVRFRDFSAAHIYAAVGNTFFGYLGKELTAVAVEHPPTWFTMVYMLQVDAMFKKTTIGKMIEKSAARSKMVPFTSALKAYMDNNAV